MNKNKILNLVKNKNFYLIAACSLSLTLITLASFGDLWLDEIWSLNFALKANTAGEIFKFQHDNNHPLNTLYLFLVREYSSFIIYRLFAILSGIGSIIAIGYIAKRYWGYYEALLSIVICGTSYPLILYFSESRGYASVIFFAVLSYYILKQNLTIFRHYRVLLFCLCSIMGIFSHPTFVIVYAALILKNFAYVLHASSELFFKKLFEFVYQQAFPFIFIVYWYLYFLRYITLGGGAVYNKIEVMNKATSYLLGMPFSISSLILVLIIIITGSIILEHQSKTEGLFFLSVLILFPVFFTTLIKPKIFYFRYFIVCFPFFYLLFSYTVCKIYKIWPKKKIKLLLMIFVIIMILGQSIRTYTLITLKRGSFSSALDYIKKNSQNSVVYIGSDHDFRNGMLVDFYSPLIFKNKKIKYLEKDEWNSKYPEWIITHSLDLSFEPASIYPETKDGIYKLEKQYRTSGISGWHWFLYKRESSL